MPDVRPVAVKLDADVHGRLRDLAAARNRSPHFLMREAIAQYVVREEQRAAFRQEAMDAWEDYRATGLHLTGAEADAWLSELEAGRDPGPPACHT